MSEEPCVLVERRGAVGLAILNRPAKLNALNSQLTSELQAALESFDADDQIGAIVITGAGERAFSAGGDMAEQRARLTGQLNGPPRKFAAAAARTCAKPVIAAVRGYCFGGGALLASACDIRIVGEDARFKFHGASYGQAPGGAVLPRIVGDAKARELLFTGDEVSAEEALRIGLANQVVRSEEVLQVALEMAGRIAANSPKAVAVLKSVINKALPNDTAQAHEEEANREVRASADSVTRFTQAADRVVGPASAQT